MGGVPLRVGSGFALAGLALALALGPRDGLPFFAVVTVSALLHESGHAIAARRTGLPVEGVFFGWLPFVAVGQGAPMKRAVTALAGPAASLLAAAALAAWPRARLEAFGDGFERLWVGDVAGLALVVNALMAGVNLLPFRPLDGGHALEASLIASRGPDRAAKAMRVLGALGALGLGAFAVAIGGEAGWTVGLLAALIAWAAWSIRPAA